MCEKLFAFMCCCTKPSNLLNQVCRARCTDRLLGLDIIVLFQFRVSLVTWNYLLFYPLGSSLESFVYRDVQGWVSKSVRMALKSSRYATEGLCALLWPTEWPSLSGSVSKNHRKWADTAPSKGRKKKKNFNTKISLHNTSRISLCFLVSYAPPLIPFPCENVYSASHSSQPPHSLIKMPFKALFFFQPPDFLKVLLILIVCPPVSLESLSTPLGLRSLWTWGSESKCLGTAWSIIKLGRWNLRKKKNKKK